MIASCPRWYDPGLAPEAAARFWAAYQRACGPAWRLRPGGRPALAACAEALAESARAVAEGNPDTAAAEQSARRDLDRVVRRTIEESASSDAG